MRATGSAQDDKRFGACSVLAGAEVDEAGEEQRGQRVEEPVLAAESARDEVQHRPGDDAEAQAVGDGIGERYEDEREERRYRDYRLMPADFGDGGKHEGTNQDE